MTYLCTLHRHGYNKKVRGAPHANGRGLLSTESGVIIIISVAVLLNSLKIFVEGLC